MLTVSSVFSGVPPLFTKLARTISGDLDCSNLSLHAHSTDGSPYQVRPQAVLYPKTTSDIKHAIAFAKEYSIPLTVAGGLQASSGGALGEGIIIDMTRYFSHIRHLNMMEHTVTVDAGASIDDVRAKLLSWNVELPVLQAEHSRATIGGLVATKSVTASTFYSGSIREWIEGMTVVVDSGEEHTIKDGITPSGRLLGIYQSIFPLLAEAGPTIRAAHPQASDDPTGYSIWNTSIGPRQLLDQLAGSEGTLAVITSVTFRVIPKKEHACTVVIPIAELRLLESTIAIAKHHAAESMFLFDATFRKLTETFHPQLIRDDIPLAPYYLLTTLRDQDEHMLHKKTAAFLKALPFLSDMCELSEHDVSKLTSHTYLHDLFTSYTKGAHMLATAGEGLIVPPHAYAECIERLDDILGKEGRPYTITGYAGSGHISVLTSFDAQSLSYEQDLMHYREQLHTVVAGFGGGISAVGGDGLERTASLPIIYNEATRDVFKKLKGAWDPGHLFNPSKKISIAKDYLLKHAIRSFL